MSLRTKLLAAILGLNGAILLLALYLLVSTQTETPVAPRPMLVTALVRLGGALAPCAQPAERRQALDLFTDPRLRSAAGELFVVEEQGEQSGALAVWTVAHYLERGQAAKEVEAGSKRQRAEDAFRRARRSEEDVRWAEGGVLAVAVPGQLPGGGRRGIVSFSVAPHSDRSGIQLVYLVMVVGAILLTTVAYVLLSRMVVKPLGRIAHAADRIAAGDYRIRLETGGGNDEFDRTIAAFNRMAREIGEYQGHLEDRVLSALGRMRKAEQHLAIAQRLAATGKLASGVAHEINNPLGGIKNAVRALVRGDLSADKTAEYLDLIADGLSRVEETVKKFLSFTPRRVEPRPTDLSGVATKAIGLARHRIQRSGAEVVENLQPSRPAVVFGDPHELMQVALNLLLNAADAVKTVARARIEVTVERGEEEAVLTVRDNGVGLTPDDQDRCFDLFFTTKQVGEGTGLGLAVAHTIVTNHGGRIELESRSGEGATFRVFLPVEEGDARSPDAKSPAGEPARS
jgi:signal transduction histidine kinase